MGACLPETRPDHNVGLGREEGRPSCVARPALCVREERGAGQLGMGAGSSVGAGSTTSSGSSGSSDSSSSSAGSSAPLACDL